MSAYLCDSFPILFTPQQSFRILPSDLTNLICIGSNVLLVHRDFLFGGSLSNLEIPVSLASDEL